MGWWKRLAARLGLGRSHLDDEIALHLDALAREHEARGLSPEEARLAARRHFGGASQVRDRHRDAQTWWRRTIDIAHREWSSAVRALVRAPRFAATVVATLALGIGFNTTLFSIADAVVFKRFPFVEQERLVIAGETLTDTRAEVSFPDFLDWRSRSRSFESLAGMGSSNWTFTLREGEPENVSIRAVSGAWFRTLGVASRLGRTIAEADDVRGAPRVLVLSDGLWRRRFGGRVEVIGQTVRLDDDPFTIVGIMGPDFSYPAGAEAWTTLVPTLAAIRVPGVPDFLESRAAGVLHLVGRLKPGVLPAAARRELDPLVVELAREDDERPRQVRAKVEPLIDDILGSARVGLLALLSAVGLLLLATMANVSGLMLIRASRRRNESAIRLALGATRAAVARQFLWESVLLSLVATGLAVVLARPVLALVLAAVPDLPRVQMAAVDRRAVAAAVFAGLLAAAMCWAVPVLSLLRINMGPSLRPDGGRTAAPGLGRWGRHALVAIEVATAVVLLTGAGLLTRSVWRVSNVDLGFDVSRLLAVTISGPATRSGDRDATVRFNERAMEALRSLPGVAAVGAAGSRPLKGPIGLDSTWQFEGQSEQASRQNPWVNVEIVTPGYFGAMRLPLVDGRLLDERDSADGAPVIVVGEGLARRVWPGTTALGKRLRAAALNRDGTDIWYTVVGVVADVRYRALASTSLDVYVAQAQSVFAASDIMVRGRVESSTLAPLVRTRIRELDAAAVVSIEAMSDALDAYQAPWRSNRAFFTAFALFTLLLSTLGVYTVLAAGVAERAREIAVRLALGATPRTIVAGVLQAGCGLAVCGIGLGLFVVVLGAGVLRSMLFDVGPRDAVTLLVAPAVVAVIALMASLLPARRAARIDPAVALRAE